VPLYEYRCATCRQQFEVLQRVGEGPNGLACPHCGASRLEKQASTFASALLSSGAAPAGGCGPSARFT
jgi:putative FmdB family regulatory protein